MPLTVVHCPCGCTFRRDAGAEKVCPSCGVCHDAGESVADAVPVQALRTLLLFAGSLLIVLLLVLAAVLLQSRPAPPTSPHARRTPSPAAAIPRTPIPSRPAPPTPRPTPSPPIPRPGAPAPAPPEDVAAAHRLIARANLGALAEAALLHSGAVEDAARLRAALDQEHRQLEDLCSRHPNAGNLRGLPLHVEPGDVVLAFATASLDPRRPHAFVGEIKSWFRTLQSGAAAHLTLRRGDAPLTVAVYVPPLEEDLALVVRRVAELPSAPPDFPASLPPPLLPEGLAAEVRRRLDALHPRHRESISADLAARVDGLLVAGRASEEDLRLIRSTFLDRIVRPLEEDYADILKKAADLEALGTESALPDVLVFKDGRRLPVRILDESPPNVEVRVDAGRIRVPSSELASLERGQALLQSLESRYQEARNEPGKLRSLLPDTAEARHSLLRERICRRLLVLDPLDEDAWAALGFTTSIAGLVRDQDVLELRDGTRRTGLIVAESPEAVTLETSLRGARGETLGIGRSVVPRTEILRLQRMPDAERSRALAQTADVEEARRRRALDMSRFHLEPVVSLGFKGLAGEGTHFEIHSAAPEAETRETALALEASFNAFQREFGVRRNTGRRIRVYFLADRDQFDAFQRASRGSVLPNPAYFSVRDNHVAAYDPVQTVEARAVRSTILKAEEEIRRFRLALDAAEEDLKKQLARLRQSLPDQAAARRKAIDALLPADRPGATEDLERWKETEAFRLRHAERSLRDFFASRRRDARQVIEANQAVLRRNRDLLAAQTRALRETLVHEAFHAFAANFLWSGLDNTRLPRWLHEGFASYFETGVQEGRNFFHGAPHPGHLATLRALARAGSLLPVASVLRAGPDIFTTEHATVPPQAAYAQSWLMAHWLVSRGIDRERLERYAQAVTAGTDPALALEQQTDLGRAELDAAVRLHLERVLAGR